MPIKRHKTWVSFVLPSDWKWEFEKELHRLDQQRVKSRRGFRMSLSLLFTIALMEGIKKVRDMSMEDVEKWCREHAI